MAKQVNSQSTKTALVSTDEVANVNNKNLFVLVTTRDGQTPDTIVGSRIVDMYHFGTRNWLQNHMWWATHNGHVVVLELATAEEIQDHIAALTAQLAAKFNSVPVAAVN
jgi:hypothetical protein